MFISDFTPLLRACNENLLAHATRVRQQEQKNHKPCEINPGVSSGFLPGQNFILIINFWAKTRAEHGTVGTEKAQALLSKNLRKSVI